MEIHTDQDEEDALPRRRVGLATSLMIAMVVVALLFEMALPFVPGR